MAERPPSNPFGPSDLIYGVKDPTPQDIADVINDYSGVVSDAAILTQERLDIFARKNVEKGEVAENQRSSSAWGKGWENFGIELGYDPPSRDLQIFINEVIGAPERGVGDRIFDAGPDSIDFQRTVQNVLNRRQQLQSEQSTPTLDVLRSRAGIAQNSIADIISMMRGGLEQPTDEDPPMDEGLGERLLKSRQATRVFGGVPPKKPATLPVPRLATAIQKRGRGLIRKLPQFRIALALQDIWESFPEETQAEILTTVQISPSEMEQINQLPHWPEIGSPLSPEVADLIVAKIDEVGKEAWDWFEGLVGRGEEPEPTGIATLEPEPTGIATFSPLNILGQVIRNTAFKELADLQRGGPEIAMLEIQNAYGGGVYSYLAEHVGDITHRMSEKPDYLEGGLEYVEPKVRGALRQLRAGYTPQREYDESAVVNAEYNKVTLEDYTASVDTARENYAEQHRKLPVHNEMQRNARDAAVAIGEKRWADAQRNLEYIEQFLDDPEAYKAEVMKYTPGYQEEAGLSKAEGGLVQGPFPRATSRFAAHAGFVDKPLYSRS